MLGKYPATAAYLGRHQTRDNVTIQSLFLVSLICFSLSIRGLQEPVLRASRLIAVLLGHSRLLNRLKRRFKVAHRRSREQLTAERSVLDVRRIICSAIWWRLVCVHVDVLDILRRLHRVFRGSSMYQ